MKLKVISTVEEPTDWTSGIVVVHKSNGSLRICIDPQQLNKGLKRRTYQVPTVEELLPELTKARVFSKCDVKSGFWHIKLDEASSKLTTFSTPFGRYKWNRMPFGIAPAPEIFQCRLEQALLGLPGVRNIHDDIIVFGEGDSIDEAVVSHDARMLALLQRCEEQNIVLNDSEGKFICKTQRLPFMGHVFTADGLKIDDRKVKALEDMPQPSDVRGVRRFLRLANYMAKFVPNLSGMAVPLRKLTQEGVQWEWTNECDQAVQKMKTAIRTTGTLKYFDPKVVTVLQCDASSTGLGAVLMQTEKQVAYASRALTKTEENYCQLEKELLALVFAVNRYHQYIYGLPVIVETDHRPLEVILKKPLAQAPKRLQRMMLELQRYDLTVVYRPGAELYLADTLSRAYLPLSNQAPDYDTMERVCLCEEEMEVEAVNAMCDVYGISDQRLQELVRDTAVDPEMQQLVQLIQSGWPNARCKVPMQVRPYFDIRDELVVANGIVLRGSRCIVPRCLREEIVKRLHRTHLGVTGTLKRARESVYWPGMNGQLRDFILRCETCRAVKVKAQPKEPLMPHDRPPRAWAKVGIDLFVIGTRNFLITVDYWSNFFEIDLLWSTDTAAVVKCLKRHFARYGTPDEVITDNGPQFTSTGFSAFAETWMFHHKTTSPYRPQANGMVESAVKTAKMLIRTAEHSGGDVWMAMLDFRNTPSQGMATSPAQRMFNRRTQTSVPISASLLQPVVTTASDEEDRKKLTEQQCKYYKSASTPLQDLAVGQRVWLHPATVGGKENVEGQISKKREEPRSYDIELDTGKILRRNRGEMVPVHQEEETQEERSETTDEEDNMQERTLKTRSGRVVRKPAWLKDYDTN